MGHCQPTAPPAHLAAGVPQREVDSDRHTARFRSHANSKESPYQNDYVVGEYLSRLMHGFQVSILLLANLVTGLRSGQ